VLRKKFADSTKVLMKVLVGVAADPPTSLTKALLRCLARILRVQETMVWKESYSLQVFQSLLSFTISEKPKIRAAAQASVCSILRGSAIMLTPDPPPVHPAAATVAKFAVQQIEESGGQRSSLATLYTLELLKEVLASFPGANLKTVCETLLRVMTLGNTLVITKAFDVLDATFRKKPKSLNAELNAQLVSALYDFQPHSKDAQPTAAWLTVMHRAHESLWHLDSGLCLSHLPKLATTCLGLFLAGDDGLTQAAKGAMTTLFDDCLAGAKGDLAANLTSSAAIPTSPLCRLFATLESCLSFQYHAVWTHSIEVMGKAFAVLGPYFKYPDSILHKNLKSMADLRETPAFSQKQALDAAIGKAVKSAGPEFVLSAIPLQITGAEGESLDFPRSWLLPVLRDHIEATELNFFVKTLLPLSSRLFNRSVAMTKDNRVAEAKVYELLQFQIWTLLPGFCIRAVDVRTAFKSVAKTLGILLQERSDIRNEIMTGLRNLVNKSVDEESKLKVKRFSKNYLPILFNLYTSEADIGSSPLAVLETIRTFVALADADVIQTFVDKLFPKLEEDGTAVDRRIKLLDITVAMTPHMNEDSIAKTFALVEKYLKLTDKGIQKKCYRILEEMLCKKDSAFVNSKMDSLSKTLVASLGMSRGTSSKAPRLRSLTQLISVFTEPKVDLVQKLIPEAVVFCGTDVAASSKTTKAALTFLETATERLVAWSPDQPAGQVIGQVLDQLCAGLAGSVASISSTIVALLHLLKKYWTKVDSDTKKKLFQISLALLKSGKRPILKQALGLAKLLTKKAHIRDFGSNVRELIAVLGEFSEEDKKAFRKVIRIILSIALKTLGVEVLHKMVPGCFQKVVLNLHKIKTKKESAKEAKEEEEEDDDEEEETVIRSGETFEDMLGDDSDVETMDKESKVKDRPKLKAKRKQVKDSWLEEKSGKEEIVDLLDPQVASKLLASKPGTGVVDKPKGVKHDFKTAPDGRIVITEGKEEPKKENVKLEMTELLDALEGPAGVGKKRKIKWKDEDSDDEEASGPKKYVAGGRGIHRPLNKDGEPPAKKRGGFGDEYRSKKAKGDMKRKGKPDPYAYIPLNVKSLNKRKGKKLQSQFKNVVGAARKGALKGKKLKVRKKKN